MKKCLSSVTPKSAEMLKREIAILNWVLRTEEQEARLWKRTKKEAKEWEREQRKKILNFPTKH